MPLASGAWPSEETAEHHRCVGVDHLPAEQLPAHEGLAGPGGLGGQHPVLSVGLLEGAQVGHGVQVQHEVDGVGGGGLLGQEEEGVAGIHPPVHGGLGYAVVEGIIGQGRGGLGQLQVEGGGGLLQPGLRCGAAAADGQQVAVHVVDLHLSALHHGSGVLGDLKDHLGRIAVHLDDAQVVGRRDAADGRAGRHGRHSQSGQQGQGQQQGNDLCLHRVTSSFSVAVSIRPQIWKIKVFPYGNTSSVR